LSKVTQFLIHTERPTVLIASQGARQQHNDQQPQAEAETETDGLHNNAGGFAGSFLVISQTK